jgi:hypothetical protein
MSVPPLPARRPPPPPGAPLPPSRAPRSRAPAAIPSLPTTLGVTPIATSRSKPSGPPSAPRNLRLSPGPAPGSLVIKHSRPVGAGSFAVEYKLEPSSPEDPWIAPEMLQSSSAVQQLDGLAPAQLVKVRVRALGDGWGPYSIEVLGRAR